MKIHQKILKSIKISAVVIITAITAFVPSAATFADSTKASVNVTSDFAPRIELSAITAGSEINSPNYSFKTIFKNIVNMSASLVNRDKNGNEIASATIWDENFDGNPSEKITNLNLDNYGGHGSFTFMVSGENEYGVSTSSSLHVNYTEVPPSVPPTGPGGGPIIPPEKIPTATAVRATVDIHNEAGEFIDTININDVREVDSINLSNLPDGTYKLTITSYDKDDNALEVTYKTIVIRRTNPTGAIVVEIGDPGEEIGYAIITLKNQDGDPDHVKSVRVEHPNPGDLVTIDVADMVAGEYDVIIDYYDLNGRLIKSEITEPIDISDDGEVPIDIEEEVEIVDTIEIYIYDEGGEVIRKIIVNRIEGKIYVYDKDGQLLFVLPYDPSQGFEIPMDGLGEGSYTATIAYKDGNGRIVESSRYTFGYDGESSVIVPDTGSFFIGNLSKEECIITGVVVAVLALLGLGLYRLKSASTSR